MRRDIGRHPHRNPHLPIQQDIWQRRRQHHRLLLAPVKVISEIHRFLLNIGQKFCPHLIHPRLSISRSRRIIPIHRTKVPLPLHQGITHLPRLRQVHHCVINRRITVRVILTHHLTHNSRRLHRRVWRLPAILIHRIQNPPVHRFQPIPHIRQRPINNHRHRIAQKITLHRAFHVALFHPVHHFALHRRLRTPSTRALHCALRRSFRS